MISTVYKYVVRFKELGHSKQEVLQMVSSRTHTITQGLPDSIDEFFLDFREHFCQLKGEHNRWKSELLTILEVNEDRSLSI